MSLVIEFRTPQNPKARWAGIAANRCFPTIAQPTGATDFSWWNDCAGQSEKPRAPPAPPSPRRSAPLGFAIPRSQPYTSELPVNDLLTNSGNSD